MSELETLVAEKILEDEFAVRFPQESEDEFMLDEESED